MSPTAMSRAFSKWWDRRKVVGGNRMEADIGWKAGAQWALETAAEQLGEGVTPRDQHGAANEERRRCIEEVLALAQALQRK